MREIKFRAWSEDCKRMFRPNKGCDLLVRIDGKMFVQLDIDELHSGIIEENLGSVLMQFTGLYDKDGNEIYEGDVLMDGTGEKYPVIFLNGMFCVKCDGFTSPITKPFLTILGNTYENPELLK